MFDAPLGVGIVLGPQANKFVQVVRPENRPVSRQVVKVVHNNGDEEVDDLFYPRDTRTLNLEDKWSSYEVGIIRIKKKNTYEKRTEHVERYEVRKCNVRPAATLLVVLVAVRVAFNGRLRRTSHHYFLPRLACDRKNIRAVMFFSFFQWNYAYPR